MSENRKVAPWWAHGYLCPHCGKPLRWLGEWHGPRFVRKPMQVTGPTRISRADEQERVVTSRAGLEAKTAVVYRHTVTLECVPCSKLLAEDQARRGYLPDDAYPSGYFVGGDQPPLGTAKPVQNERPQRGRM